MTPKNIPYLTGGLFFDLLLEARKTRFQARTKLHGESDGLSDPNLMSAFIYVVNGERNEYTGDTLNKTTSQYKTCQINDSVYIPFGETAILSAFESDVKNSNPVLIKRMSELIHNFLQEQRYEWLVKALIETIVADVEIPNETEFRTTADTIVTKSNLPLVEQVELQYFLISVLHFILKNRPDNMLGRSTFESWYVQNAPRTPWKFNKEDLGQSITQSIDVTFNVLYNEELEETQIPPEKAPLIYNTNSVAPDISLLKHGNMYLIDRCHFGETPKDENMFDNYLKKAEDFYSNVRTLLYPEMGCNFGSLYVCNDLKVQIPAISYEIAARSEIFSNITANGLFNISRRIIIHGKGGIGKSMMMQHLFLDAIKTFKVYDTLPILSDLKNFSVANTVLLDFIYNDVRAFDNDIELHKVKDRIEKGNCILLLDGYDELSQEEKTVFNKALTQFIKAYPAAHIVISSRPRNTFIQPGHFMQMNILPFDKEKALALIDKLDFYDKVAKDKFRKDLDSKLFRTHYQFASNPLLLTIMLMTYTAYGEIPAKQHVFYAKAYDVMSRAHDALKGSYVRPMHTNMSPDDFSIYLAEFCARTYRTNTFCFSEQSFCEYMNSVIKHQGNKTNATANDFLLDIVDNLCLMYRESGKYYFIHRSFQEYFCALFFSRQLDEKLWKIGEYFETKTRGFETDLTFDMLYDMIPERIERYIFLPFLTNLWEICDSQNGYWTYLETMFPTILSGVGEPGEETPNKPTSYLLDFFLNVTHSRINPELYNVSWPKSIELCDKLEWVEAETRWFAGNGKVMTRVEIMDLDTWEQEHKNIFDDYDETPTVVGATYRFEISRILSDPETFKDLIDFMEDDEFPLKKEYSRIRGITEYIRRRANKKANENDWFDDF